MPQNWTAQSTLIGVKRVEWFAFVAIIALWNNNLIVRNVVLDMLTSIQAHVVVRPPKAISASPLRTLPTAVGDHAVAAGGVRAQTRSEHAVAIHSAWRVEGAVPADQGSPEGIDEVA